MLNFIKYLTLPNPSRLKMGEEDWISHEFAVWLREMYFNKRLNLVFTHIPNEGAGKLAMVRKKAIGMVTGAADWVITNGEKTIFIELKAPKGKQTISQHFFEKWCNSAKVPYYVCHSVQEAKDIVLQTYNLK